MIFCRKAYNKNSIDFFSYRKETNQTSVKNSECQDLTVTRTGDDLSPDNTPFLDKTILTP